MRHLIAVLPLLAAVAAAFAQVPSPSQPADAPAPTFEVASVKRSTSANAPFSLNSPPGRFTVTNVPLRIVITIAYRLAPYQYVGMPGWVDSERFDIAAKAPDGATPEQMPLMLRSLLAERFKFVAHTETRDTPIYALVLARSDGKLGPKLVPSTVDCAPIIAERIAAARARGPAPPQGVPFGLPAPGEKPICTARMSAAPGQNGGPPVMTYVAGAQSLQTLTQMISSVAGRPVVDRTGLSGLFDYEIKISPPRPLMTGPAGGATPAAPLDDGPSVFEAVQELGLKLESQRGPIEYLVIDSVERPTPD